MSDNDITRRHGDDPVDTTKRKMDYPTPMMEAAKKERTAAEIAEGIVYRGLVKNYIIKERNNYHYSFY